MKQLACHGIAHYLNEVNVVISATGSDHPILNASDLAHLANRTKPLLCIDLAVPRDFSDDLSSIPCVTHIYLDDLKARCEAAKASRLEAVEEAETIIQSQLQHYNQHYNNTNMVT